MEAKDGKSLPLNRLSAFWQGIRNVELISNPIPAVGPREVLLKVHSCAVCGSDIRIFNHGNARVKPGTIIGHEISGDVVAIGKDVSKFNVGDKVALAADVPCGECAHCKAGRGNCCDINYAIGHQFEGGFSEYMLLPELVVELGPVHRFSKVSYDEAALAEPLACCLNGFEQALCDTSKPESVVVFGAGPIGIMLCMLARFYGARQIILIDINQGRLDTVLAMGHVDQILNSTKIEVVAAVKELTGQLGADVVFTACSIPEAQEQGVAMLAKRGVINLFGGLPKGARAISFFSNEIHYKEAYMTGSHGCTPAQHRKALDLIESGKIDVLPLITHRFPLKDLGQAYEVAAAGYGLKIMVNP